MAVFRIEKNKDYTVISNRHLKERDMSYKAKGLLTFMLSLPDDWDYSIKGLVSVSKENETAIRGMIKELETFGYLKRTRVTRPDGKFEYQYDVFEKPYMENPHTVNPHTEVPHTDNPPQINTKEQSTKEQNTKESSTKNIKHKYGLYKNVYLTDTELEKLKEEFPSDYEERIENVSSYCASTGRTYKNYLATIRNWARRDNDNSRKDTGSSAENRRTERTEVDYGDSHGLKMA